MKREQENTRMENDPDEPDEAQWITYVVRNPRTKEYVTFSEPYRKNAPEHDTTPNHKSFLALYKGSDVRETIARANEFILKQQEEEIENISFDKIREINKITPKESYVELPGGHGYRIKTIDELKRKGKKIE